MNLEFKISLIEIFISYIRPSSSADKLSKHSDNEYYYAEYLGHSGGDCQRVFKNCARSLLDYFSNVHHLSEGVLNIMG